MARSTKREACTPSPNTRHKCHEATGSNLTAHRRFLLENRTRRMSWKCVRTEDFTKSIPQNNFPVMQPNTVAKQIYMTLIPHECRVAFAYALMLIVIGTKLAISHSCLCFLLCMPDRCYAQRERETERNRQMKTDGRQREQQANRGKEKQRKKRTKQMLQQRQERGLGSGVCQQKGK